MRKTAIVNSILKVLRAKKVRVLLCAPTGRAVKRLSESTGLEAKTVHGPLEADPKIGGFKRDEENPLECDLLVLDEASMEEDVPLMRALLRALPAGAALFLMGDVDRLPSVGPGQVLADVSRPARYRYATTIQKSQGSEYPAVVIPLATQHYVMLVRNPLYIGVTRGKRVIGLVGQRKALRLAVRNGGTLGRWSKLREWMNL